MAEPLILEVGNVVTSIVRGEMNRDTYQCFRRVLGYRPEGWQHAIRNYEAKVIAECKRKGYDAEQTRRAVEVARNWDGYISDVRYNRGHCGIYQKRPYTHFSTGLLSTARAFFDKYTISYRLVDVRPPIPPHEYDFEMSEEFEERDYLIEVRDKACKQKRGIIKAATGSGKTALMASVIAELGVLPFVFYVTSIELLHQAASELKRFIKYHGISIEVGMVGGGNKDIKPLTVMTIQTAVRALGADYKGEMRFDSEDTDDNTDISDIKKDIYDLIHSAKGIIFDEVQHVSCKSCQLIADHSENAYYRFGASICPESVVEIRGSALRYPKSINIESVWNNFFNGSNIEKIEGYEIIDLKNLNVESRGWDEDLQRFVWKKIKKIIRHKIDEKVLSLKFRGSNLRVTKDHSVYKLDLSEKFKWVHNKKKFFSKITCPISSELNAGDILVGDMGDDLSSVDFTFGPKEIIELILEGAKFPQRKRISITCDRKKLLKVGLLDPLMKQNIRRSKHGSSLGAEYFLSLVNQGILDISEGRYIYSEGGGNSINLNIDVYDLCWMIGFFLGDGWIGKTENRVSFSVSDEEVGNIYRRFKESSWHNSGVEIRTPTDGGRCKTIRICNVLFVDLLNGIFKEELYAENKKIPKFIIFNKDPLIRRSCLSGLEDSDGSVPLPLLENRNRAHRWITTISKQMALDIIVLLRSLGVQSSVYVRKPQLGGLVRKKNGEYRRIVARHPSFQIAYSGNNLKGIRNGHKGDVRLFFEERYFETRLRNIFEENFNGFVYDLEMEGHPSFVANGVLVHNSATPYRDKGDDILIEACFGKCIAEISASFLIRKGWLVKPEINFVHIDNMRNCPYSSYPQIYKYALKENSLRNEWIAKISTRMVDEGRLPLVLCTHIDHGKMLNSMIPGSVFLHGSISKKKRLEHLELMRQRKCGVTITTSIFDEGIDVRPLDTLILSGSGKSSTRALQRVGRILRPWPNRENNQKKNAIVVDFVDHVKYLEVHSSKRRKIYRTEEEFVITDIKI